MDAYSKATKPPNRDETSGRTRPVEVGHRVERCPTGIVAEYTLKPIADGNSLPLRPKIPQAAKRLNCSEKTIRRMIADGRLKAYRVGGSAIRVDRDSLLALEKPMFAA